MIITIPVTEGDRQHMEGLYDSIKKNGPYAQDYVLLVATPSAMSDDHIRKHVNGIAEVFGGEGDNGRAFIKITSNDLVSRAALNSSDSKVSSASAIRQTNLMFFWIVKLLKEEIPIKDNWLLMYPYCRPVNDKWLDTLKFELRNYNSAYLGEVINGVLQQVAIYPPSYHAHQRNVNENVPNTLWQYPSTTKEFHDRCRWEHVPASHTNSISIVGEPNDRSVLVHVNRLSAKGEDESMHTATTQVSQSTEKKLVNVAPAKNPHLPTKEEVDTLLSQKKWQLKPLAEHFGMSDMRLVEAHLESLGYEVYSKSKWIRVKP